MTDSHDMQSGAVFHLHQGSSPLLVSMPHIGTAIPPDLLEGYAPEAMDVEDTDWHLHTLYDFLPALSASVLRPHYSRYLIDLNRPPDDTPIYPGASNTELCPTHFFSGVPLYLAGHEPSVEERLRRRETYWRPYHDALAAELARIKAMHGYALLWDAHSIRSQIPWLFEGKLPDLNIGTANGASADASITDAVAAACGSQQQVTTAVNGRFKGGYITRHYGQPAQNIHAIQLEMCQSLYMQEVPPYAYDEALATNVQPLMQDMVLSAMRAAAAHHGK